MKLFFLRFVAYLAVAFTVVYLPPVREHVIGPFTYSLAQVSGGLIQLFGGEVWVHENILRIQGFAVQVLDMCNGVEATLILWGALLAFPAPWGYRLKGLLVGTLTVHALNIVRIISLLYIGAWDKSWFDWAHAYLWDALIMLDILVVFLVWLRMMPVPPASPPPGEPPASSAQMA
ncbi:MAG: exosortase H [Halothiobacillaceae bacterium]|nr:exosortase H [Halothiobacillaceae bacterium]